VTVADEACAAAQQGFDATASMLLTRRNPKEKLYHVKFDGGRYAGFSNDKGRTWVQYRQGAEEGLEWPPWAESFVAPLQTAYEHCESVGKAALRAVLRQVAHPQAEDVDTLVGQGSHPYGPSVMRFFMYHDAPRGVKPGNANSSASSHHADMGLLTVAPPSTIPALELWADSGSLDKPESTLQPQEWIVFAGETLGYLTSGAVRAPIHRVPWVDHSTVEVPRMSMPFFLRADPNMHLTALTSGKRMTCQQLMTDHIVSGSRPWRQKAAAARSGGGGADW